MQPLLAAFFAGWEIVLLFAVVLILLGTRSLFGPGEDLSKRAEEPKTPAFGFSSLVVWVAWGFGSGRVPIAPGTFGSAVGLLWFAILLCLQNLWAFLGVVVAVVFGSVWICGKAERILQQRDPSSIVLDEICAVPLCFVPWLVSEWVHKGVWPPLETFFGAKSWYITAIIFVLFRIFDILKPWPVRQSQKLPGGWGVVVDDVLAAVYVCLLSLVVFH